MVRIRLPPAASPHHRFRDDFTGYARDQDAPTVTRHLTSPRPKRAGRDTHSLPRERVRSPAHLALAARSGEGPLPIRFADLGHRARKTGGLLNSRPIFRADRTGSWLRMRHLAGGFVTATGVRQKGGVRGNQVLRCCDGRASTRKTMIVALARKLLIGLWRFVTTGGASLIPQCERHFRLAHPSSRHSAPPLCGHASAG